MKEIHRQLVTFTVSSPTNWNEDDLLNNEMLPATGSQPEYIKRFNQKLGEKRTASDKRAVEVGAHGFCVPV